MCLLIAHLSINSVECVQGCVGLVQFSWVSHGRRSIFFLKMGPYMLPGGWTCWLALGSNYKPLQNLPLSALFFFNFTFYLLFKLACQFARGVTGFFHFLELATVGGRFYFSKWCVTCCQRGTYFDLPWGRAINPSKNYLFRTVFLQFQFSRYSNSVESVQGCLGSVPLSWVSHGRRSILFLQRGPYMLPRG